MLEVGVDLEHVVDAVTDVKAEPRCRLLHGTRAQLTAAASAFVAAGHYQNNFEPRRDQCFEWRHGECRRADVHQSPRSAQGQPSECRHLNFKRRGGAAAC